MMPDTTALWAGNKDLYGQSDLTDRKYPGNLTVERDAVAKCHLVIFFPHAKKTSFFG